jgi:hypothetical protein
MHASDSAAPGPDQVRFVTVAADTEPLPATVIAIVIDPARLGFAARPLS